MAGCGDSGSDASTGVDTGGPGDGDDDGDGDSDGDGGSAGGSDGSTDVDGDGTAADSTGSSGLSLGGTLTDFLDGLPVGGATVCVRDQPDVACVQSDPEGTFLLEGVAEGPVTLEIEHTAYPHYLVLLFADSDHTAWGNLLVSRDAAALLVQQAGGEIDPLLGAITMSVVDADGGGQDGVTADLSPMDAEVGPIYLDAMGLPDPAATETSTSGYFGWANITPGSHSFAPSHASLGCTSVLDPDGTGVTVPIEADTITVAVAYVCE